MNAELSLLLSPQNAPAEATKPYSLAGLYGFQVEIETVVDSPPLGSFRCEERLRNEIISTSPSRSSEGREEEVKYDDRNGP
jgi:hypothetical protein